MTAPLLCLLKLSFSSLPPQGLITFFKELERRSLAEGATAFGSAFITGVGVVETGDSIFVTMNHPWTPDDAIAVEICSQWPGQEFVMTFSEPTNSIEGYYRFKDGTLSRVHAHEDFFSTSLFDENINVLNHGGEEHVLLELY